MRLSVRDHAPIVHERPGIVPDGVVPGPAPAAVSRPPVPVRLQRRMGSWLRRCGDGGGSTPAGRGAAVTPELPGEGAPSSRAEARWPVLVAVVVVMVLTAVRPAELR